MDREWLSPYSPFSSAPLIASKDLIQDLLFNNGKSDKTGRYAASFYQEALDLAAIGILIADPSKLDAPIVYVNATAEEITGYSADEIIGRNCRFLQGSDRLQPDLKEISRAIADASMCKATLRNYRKDGSMFWNEMILSPISDGNNAIYYIGLIRDVTEYQEASEQYRRLSNFDDLTGLLNRKRFIADLEQILNEFPDDEFFVATIDVYRLRDVNSTFGQAAGDAVLHELARRICLLPSQVLLGRFGGGEFALALRIKPDETSELLIRQMMEFLADPYTIAGATLSVLLNAGYSQTLVGQKDVGIPLQEAVLALYDAKKRGPGETRASDEALGANVRLRLRLTTELREAVINNEFKIYYQPQVDLASGRIVSAEALIRWEHPVFGLQLPARFLDVAEESGVIVDIGDWVLNEAAAFSARLNRDAPRCIPIGVNISQVQFQRRDMAQEVRRALEQTHCDAAWLIIESTESLLSEISPKILEEFRDMRRLGVGLAIDDFGKGYSSLSLLRDLPFTDIKIDASFVTGISDHPHNAAIVDAALRMAVALNLRVTCEGVETEADQDRLLEIGCQFAQGVFFHPPLQAEKFFQLVNQGRFAALANEEMIIPKIRRQLGGSDQTKIIEELKR